MVDTKTRTKTVVGIGLMVSLVGVMGFVAGIYYYGRPVTVGSSSSSICPACPACPVCPACLSSSSSGSSPNAGVIKKEISCTSFDSESGTNVTAYASGEKLSDGTYRIKAWGGGFLKLTVSAFGAPKGGDHSKTETVTGEKTFTCDAGSKEINFETAGPYYNGISVDCTSGTVVAGSVLNIAPYGSGRIEGMIHTSVRMGAKAEGKATLRVKFYTVGNGTITGAPTCIKNIDLE